MEAWSLGLKAWKDVEAFAEDGIGTIDDQTIPSFDLPEWFCLEWGST